MAYGSYDASAPFAMDELEVDTTWTEAGLYVHRPKQVYFEMTGLDAEENYLEFTFACDNVVSPPALLTVAIYDPDATPGLYLDEVSVRHGGRARGRRGAPARVRAHHAAGRGDRHFRRRRGRHLPDRRVRRDRRPDHGATLRPAAGSVQVRVSNGSRRASAQVTVVAAKGVVKAAPNGQAGARQSSSPAASSSPARR